MKKILIVAALLATTAAPAFAAKMADAPAKAPTATECFFLPFMPGCLDMWKAKHDDMMAKWKVAAVPAPKAAPMMPAPKMPMMPTCTKAAAGAGHLLDCKM